MYVIYKENNIPGIGGFHPQGIETNLSTYKGWTLALCPDDRVHEYKMFDFIPVSTEVAIGFRVLSTLPSGVTTGLTHRIDMEGGPNISVTLTETDLINKSIAEKFISNLELKIETRVKIRELKDLEDDLVDLKRLVHSLVIFVSDDWDSKSETEKTASKFKEIIPKIGVFSTDSLNPLLTIKNDLEKLSNIIEDEVAIAAIVDEFYLTKKL